MIPKALLGGSALLTVRIVPLVVHLRSVRLMQWKARAGARVIMSAYRWLVEHGAQKMT